jgi:hypothetical protein
MFDLLLKALVSYIEKNPAVIERLVEQVVEALIARMAKSNAAA